MLHIYINILFVYVFSSMPWRTRRYTQIDVDECPERHCRCVGRIAYPESEMHCRRDYCLERLPPRLVSQMLKMTASLWRRGRAAAFHYRQKIFQERKLLLDVLGRAGETKDSPLRPRKECDGGAPARHQMNVHPEVLYRLFGRSSGYFAAEESDLLKKIYHLCTQSLRRKVTSRKRKEALWFLGSIMKYHYPP